MHDTPDLRQMALLVTSKVFWPQSSSEINPEVDPDLRALLPTLSEQEQSILSTFEANVRGIFVSASVPYRMAFSSVYSRRLQALTSAERIRRIPVDDLLAEPGRSDKLSESAEREAAAAASRALDSQLGSAEGKQAFTRDLIFELIGHLQDPNFAQAVEELLRQCTALAWAALETLVVDLHRRRVGAPPGAKAGLKALLSDDRDAKTVMQDLGVWRLFQERHVIVHRGGIVDRRFVELTGADVAPGSRLTITPDELAARLCAIRRAAKLLLGAPSPRGTQST